MHCADQQTQKMQPVSMLNFGWQAELTPTMTAHPGPERATQRGTSFAAIACWRPAHPSHGLALLGKLLLELSLHFLSVLYTSMRLRHNLLQVGQGTRASALGLMLIFSLYKVLKVFGQLCSDSPSLSAGIHLVA